MSKLWVLKETYSPEGFSTYTAIDNGGELVDYLQDVKSDSSTKLELRSFTWEDGKLETI